MFLALPVKYWCFEIFSKRSNPRLSRWPRGGKTRRSFCHERLGFYSDLSLVDWSDSVHRNISREAVWLLISTWLVGLCVESWWAITVGCFIFNYSSNNTDRESLENGVSAVVVVFWLWSRRAKNEIANTQRVGSCFNNLSHREMIMIVIMRRRRSFSSVIADSETGEQ